MKDRVPNSGRRAPRATTMVRRLLRIRNMLVREVILEEAALLVRVRPSWHRPRCGECGAPGPGYDRSPTRRWRSLNLGAVRAQLEYEPQRVSCDDWQGPSRKFRNASGFPQRCRCGPSLVARAGACHRRANYDSDRCRHHFSNRPARSTRVSNRRARGARSPQRLATGHAVRFVRLPLQRHLPHGLPRSSTAPDSPHPTPVRRQPCRAS